MSRWKVAGQLAVIHHDREQQLQQKRLIKEQLEESKKNGTLLRSLARARNKVGIEARATLTITGRWHQTLVEENMRQTLEKQAATSVVYRRQDQRCKRLMLQRLQQMDDARSRAHAMKTAIEMVQVEERETDEQIAVLKAKREARIREADKVHVPDPSRVARRVELAHQQYALQLARNRSLVQQVTHLEGERDKVLKVNQQLRNDLNNLSKELDAYIEESSTTYEQRDMNRRNIAKLKEHLARSTLSYNADMQLLQFKIDVLKHMEHFMLTKNKFRVDAGLQRQRERRNLPSLAERRRLNMLHELKMVRADLDQEDLSVMASTFIQLQQENHMLFHNVSHIRNSCDTLNLEVDALRQQTKELRTSKQKEAHELRARRAELMDKIQACSREADRKEKEVTVVEQTIASYIQGVVNILHKLSYSEQDFTRLAGVFQRVGERNVRKLPPLALPNETVPGAGIMWADYRQVTTVFTV